MSRLTKYLRQRAVYAPVERTSVGTPKLNAYGEPSYGATKTVKCRREPYVAHGLSVGGSVAVYRYSYYLDTTVTPMIGDKLDDRVIQDVQDYYDGMGILVGYEVHT